MKYKPDRSLSLMALGIPMFLETFLRTLIGTVNTFMLGRYSDNAVAAVGVANQYMNMVIMLFSVISVGTGILVSQNLGAGNKKTASEICTAALSTNFILGTVIGSTIFFCSSKFINVMGLEQVLVPDATIYLKLMGISAFMQAVTSTISIIFRNYGNAKVPMYIMLLTNILNVIGNYIVVFQPGTLPLVGVSGVATVRLISEFVGFIFMIGLLARYSFDIDFKGLIHVKMKHVRAILSLGVMTGAEGLAYNIAGILTTAMIATFGAVALSAKIYLTNIIFYVCIVGMSLGQATQILIGRMVGAGEYDKAYKFAWRSWRIGISSNIGFSILALILSRHIYSMFTQNTQIINLCVLIMVIDIAIEAGRSLNHNITNSLRAAGFVKIPMIVAVISIFAFNAGLGYVFGIVLGMGLPGMWLAMAIDELFRGTTAVFFWRRGDWRSSSLVHGNEEISVAAELPELAVQAE